MTGYPPAGLGLYTKFIAQTGDGSRLVEHLLSAAALMESAPGCRLYIVNTTPDDADTVWVTEVWDGEEHHRASLSIEGVPELIAQARPLLAGPPEQIRVTPVGGKGLES